MRTIYQVHHRVRAKQEKGKTDTLKEKQWGTVGNANMKKPGAL